MALGAALLAVLEVMLFGFLGNVIDWLSSSDPETFLRDEWPTLLIMSVIILLIKPRNRRILILCAAPNLDG